MANYSKKGQYFSTAYEILIFEILNYYKYLKFWIVFESFIFSQIFGLLIPTLIMKLFRRKSNNG